MGVLFLSIFFLVAGLIFLFWPEEMRDWILKSYAHAGFARPILMEKLMFTRGYILAFRVAGVIAIVISSFLVLLYARHS